MNVIHQILTKHIGIWTAAETEKKSGRGRTAGNAANIYGIKKLRELILELAVRGKLIPQDTNDEPASDLLKRIQIEKIKFVSAGKIKKENRLPTVKSDEVTYQLPNGWEWVRFGEIALHNSGKTLDRGRNFGTLHDYITTSNLYWGCFDLGNVRQMPIREEELERCSAQKGDLLICEGGEAGRAAVWFYEKEICFQNHIHRARFFCGIDPYYAYRFFEKLNATGEINQHRKGVGISNMSGKALASIIFPLPPIAEQRRIVAKVDELMALCDRLESQHTNAVDTHEKLVSHLLGTLTQSQSAQDFSANWQRIAAHFDALFTTESSIDALKQTLLQLAVMGKLVPQDANDEPASELLKSMHAKKAKLVAEGKIKNDKPLAARTDEKKPFDLHDGWAWCRFDDLWESSFYGPRFGKEDYVRAGGIPTIRTTDMTADGMIELDSPPEVLVPDEKIDLYQIKYGDLLVTRSGSIGTMALFFLDLVAIPSAYLIRIRFSSLLEPRFGLLYLMSPLGQNFLGLNSTSVGVPNVNATKMGSFPFPLPPLREQLRIVAKVDELMMLCDQLKSRITNANQLQRKLADVLVEQ
jgi:type I restriction enzyme S subunit